ncbi:MAG TPA: prepilin-type N-terminal cleavage/methylation domain-containing protein [Methylomirabilota bacterium]|nr:prepilin-type N-terminal cleavage/methylation domain-containing protein [Methylomirabilota bacterium]
MQYGFTLIELMVVMSLIASLGFLSTGFYARFYSQNNVANVVDQLTGELHKAQIYSMIGKQKEAWGVHNGATQIVLFQGNTYATRNSALDEQFTVNNIIVISGFTDIIFTRMTGTPSATPTITITGKNSTKTIVVTSQGAVNK